MLKSKRLDLEIEYAEKRFVDAAVRCSSRQELDGDVVAGGSADVAECRFLAALP